MPIADRTRYNEYMAAYMQRRYHIKRAEIVAALGGKCVRCAANDNLEIDHADATKKSFDIAKLWNTKREKLDPELAKCQLLCAPCHEAKSILDRGHQPTDGRHGTLSTYRNCKCDLCRAAKADYMRDYKLRRKMQADNDNVSADESA